MKYQYIFFDWGYTLISKFENVDDKINNLLKKYNLKWDNIFKTWKNYQILNSLGRVTEKEPYKGMYNFVGGKVEEGETNDEAAYRELFEETGISNYKQ